VQVMTAYCALVVRLHHGSARSNDESRDLPATGEAGIETLPAAAVDPANPRSLIWIVLMLTVRSFERRKISTGAEGV
jgi:hypothetical protein